MRKAHPGRFSAVCTAALVLGLVLATCIAPAAAKEPPLSGPYPGPGITATQIQRLLYRHECFGSRQTESDAVDSRFGADSRRAMSVFLDTLRTNYPEASAFTINTVGEVLRIFTLPQIEKTPFVPFCRGSKFRAEYFLDQNKHTEFNSGQALPPGQSSSASCRKDDVARSYLSDKRADYARLIDTLSLVVDRFDTIFPDASIDYTAGMNEDGLERLKKGKKGVTHAGTRRALTEARDAYKRLSFAQGIRANPDCARCYRVNDWIFLQNIAQANGGYLIGKATADTPLQRVEVRAITEASLAVIEKNVKIYRSLVARYNELIAEYVNSSDRTKAMEKELSDLDGARETELVLIVSGLLSKPGVGALMKDIRQQYSCDGFTGESVDQ